MHNRKSGSTPSCRPSGASSASDAVFETSPTLGYDDVSEFVNTYGGVYVMLGAQDCRLGENGGLEPVPGGRGMIPNHNPRFCVNDDALLQGVRLHCNVAYDHLTGTLAPRT
ncbi:hypothetical protein [Streptomyces sp. KL116D]|uniref:hypothetical protein n=1 Tax=Streptomyces sp. KL116D TaxID=3045152 RepID=UPI0035588038